MYAKIAKIALWVIIVLLLLPGTEREKRELRGTAQKTVDEVGTFCTRNASFCDGFRNAYDGVYDKVRYGIELVEDLLRDHVVADDGAGPHPAPQPEPRPGGGATLQKYSHTSSLDNSGNAGKNTLKQEDLAPVWRGPKKL
jgi:hypothetical protein